MQTTNNYYIFENKKYNRVTSLASNLGKKNKYGIMTPFSQNWGQEIHCKKGTAVHKFCELSINNPESTIKYDKRIENRVNSFKEFKKEVLCNYKILNTELTLKSDKYSVAGTLDLLLKDKSKYILCDYKSSYSKKACMCQMGGYLILLKENDIIKKYDDIKEVWIILLTDNGYNIKKLSKLEILQSVSIFKSMLNVYTFWR